MQLSEIDTASNLVELFLKRADAKGDAPFLGVKRGGGWQTLSWRETAEKVGLLAENLRALGLAAGDRVMLVSENRPEWCIADLAIMAARVTTSNYVESNSPYRVADFVLAAAGSVAIGKSAGAAGQSSVPGG